jgi:ribosomal protein L11 methylase PrmA
MDENSWSRGIQFNIAVSHHSTFGELTPATFDGIAYVLNDIVGDRKLQRCTLLDVGSGRGRLAMCVANRLSVQAVLGIEIDKQLHKFAQHNSIGTSFIFAKGDLMHLTSLSGANIVLGVCVCVLLF